MIVLVAMIVMAGIKVFEGGISTKVELANESVGSISTENKDLEKLHERGRKSRKARAAAAGSDSPSTTGAAKSDGSAADGAPGEKKGNHPAAAGQGAVAAQGGCGGFNPFLIPIALGLAGLLGYVILKSKKG
jgi:hypothetical protein